MTVFIAYYRVSTDRQGISGLGLDAQRADVLRHIGAGQLVNEYTEIESGKRHKNRPQLLAALAECRREKATLVIAELDRLGRNVAFISALLKSGADFVCCDNPHANRLMLHMLAAFAEHEREQISQRTKAALQRIKAELGEKGTRTSRAGRVFTKLGNPRPKEALDLARAVHLSRRPAPAIVTMMQRLEAGMSCRAVARELNRLNIKTGRGCEWFGVTVKVAMQQAQTGKGIAA
jgi:DNA invertase Pin-like site-specific DNA recombinase